MSTAVPVRIDPRALRSLVAASVLALLAGCSPAPSADGADAATEPATEPGTEPATEPKRRVTSAMTLERGREFLAENGERPGVVTTASGLQYEVLASGAGTGAQPGPTDLVTTHYHGTFIDGKVFDSSVDRGEPMEFRVDGVIPGWTEALQLMRPGDKWKLFVPSELAYGERGNIGIRANQVLIFEVELIAVRAS